MNRDVERLIAHSTELRARSRMLSRNSQSLLKQAAQQRRLSAKLRSKSARYLGYVNAMQEACLFLETDDLTLPL